MKTSDRDHPFYKPLWRRIAIVAVTAIWAALEIFRGGSGLWIALSCGSLAYTVWVFLLTYPRQDRSPPSE